MTIRDLYKTTNLVLSEVDIILEHVINKPKEYIYAHPDQPLRAEQIKKTARLILRRKRGEPIAYLIGHKEFYGLDFKVNKHVLIPRPDTETLIDAVLSANIKHPIILDIGTGSGNIAVTLKYLLPKATVIASDISRLALRVARINAKRNHTQVKFFHSDIFAAIPKRFQRQIDIITCNAPYLTKTEAKKAGLRYEPKLALTPAGSAVSIMAQVLAQAPQWLAPKGKIFLEIGYSQAPAVQRLAKKYFPHSPIKVIKDLGGWDRVVVIG